MQINVLQCLQHYVWKCENSHFLYSSTLKICFSLSWVSSRLPSPPPLPKFFSLKISPTTSTVSGTLKNEKTIYACHVQRVKKKKILRRSANITHKNRLIKVNRDFFYTSWYSSYECRIEDLPILPTDCLGLYNFSSKN